MIVKIFLILCLIDGYDSYISNEVLYAITSGGQLFSINQTHGIIKWTQNLSAPEVLNKGLKNVYSNPKDGTFYLINEGATKLRLFPYTIPELVQTSPLLSNNYILYTGDKKDHWYTINITTGAILSSMNAQDTFLKYSCPLYPNHANSRLYISRTDYYLTAFDTRLSCLLWNVTYSSYKIFDSYNYDKHLGRPPSIFSPYDFDKGIILPSNKVSAPSFDSPAYLNIESNNLIPKKTDTLTHLSTHVVSDPLSKPTYLSDCKKGWFIAINETNALQWILDLEFPLISLYSSISNTTPQNLGGNGFDTIHEHDLNKDTSSLNTFTQPVNFITVLANDFLSLAAVNINKVNFDNTLLPKQIDDMRASTKDPAQVPNKNKEDILQGGNPVVWNHTLFAGKGFDSENHLQSVFWEWGNGGGSPIPALYLNQITENAKQPLNGALLDNSLIDTNATPFSHYQMQCDLMRHNEAHYHEPLYAIPVLVSGNRSETLLGLWKRQMLGFANLPQIEDKSTESTSVNKGSEDLGKIMDIKKKLKGDSNSIKTHEGIADTLSDILRKIDKIPNNSRNPSHNQDVSTDPPNLSKPPKPGYRKNKKNDNEEIADHFIERPSVSETLPESDKSSLYPFPVEVIPFSELFSDAQHSAHLPLPHVSSAILFTDPSTSRFAAQYMAASSNSLQALTTISPDFDSHAANELKGSQLEITLATHKDQHSFSSKGVALQNYFYLSPSNETYGLSINASSLGQYYNNTLAGYLKNTSPYYGLVPSTPSALIKPRQRKMGHFLSITLSVYAIIITITFPVILIWFTNTSRCLIPITAFLTSFLPCKYREPFLIFIKWLIKHTNPASVPIRVGKIQYDANCVLGYGSMGTVVYRGTFEKREVAVKRLLILDIQKNISFTSLNVSHTLPWSKVAQREINTLVKCDRHDNVVRYYAAETKGEFIYIAIELCQLTFEAFAIYSESKQRSRQKLAMNKNECVTTNGDLSNKSSLTNYSSSCDLSDKSKESSGFDGGLHKDLYSMIKNPKTSNNFLDERAVIWRDVLKHISRRELCQQMLNGISHLHALNIAHRDIKPHNVLISIRGPLNRVDYNDHINCTNPVIKVLISDFGISKYIDIDKESLSGVGQLIDATNNKATALGTLGWTAREILLLQNNNQYSKEHNNSKKPDDCLFISSEQNYCLNSSTAISGEPYPPYFNNSKFQKNGYYSSKTFEASTEIQHLNGLTPLQTLEFFKAADCFSAGCVMYYVLTDGQHPFDSHITNNNETNLPCGPNIYTRQANIISGTFNFADLSLTHFDDVCAINLINQMISTDPKQRPTLKKCLRHYFFWDNETRLQFLLDFSDLVEKAELETSPLLQLLERNSSFVLGERTDWKAQIDPELQADLRKFRNYRTYSIRDLLRALRNKKHHYQELPDELKKSLGTIPDQFLTYFVSRFPFLLTHMYSTFNAYYSNKLKTNVNNDQMYSKYGSLEQTMFSKYF